MPVIILETIIHADIETCFDLSRSIDLHQITTAHTKEKAIAGITKGLIGLNETVTWQAVHFGIKQKLTSIITVYEKPYHFRDEQLKGAFKFIKHDHYFQQEANHVIMKDIFQFQSPLGILGELIDKLIMTSYLKHLLIQRNNIIKQYAESGKGKQLL